MPARARHGKPPRECHIVNRVYISDFGNRRKFYGQLSSGHLFILLAQSALAFTMIAIITIVIPVKDFKLKFSTLTLVYNCEGINECVNFTSFSSFFF